MKQEKAGAGLTESERMLAALLAANEELRSTVAQLSAQRDRLSIRLVEMRNQAGAWMRIAAAADENDCYGAIYPLALQQMQSGKTDMRPMREYFRQRRLEVTEKWATDLASKKGGQV